MGVCGVNGCDWRCIQVLRMWAVFIRHSMQGSSHSHESLPSRCIYCTLGFKPCNPPPCCGRCITPVTCSQRHAAKGQHAAALEAIFSSDSSSSAAPPAAGAADGGEARGLSLSGHMEVVDAVLRLAADASNGNDALRYETVSFMGWSLVGMRGWCGGEGGGVGCWGEKGRRRDRGRVRAEGGTRGREREEKRA